MLCPTTSSPSRTTSAPSAGTMARQAAAESGCPISPNAVPPSSAIAVQSASLQVLRVSSVGGALTKLDSATSPRAAATDFRRRLRSAREPAVHGLQVAGVGRHDVVLEPAGAAD